MHPALDRDQASSVDDLRFGKTELVLLCDRAPLNDLPWRASCSSPPPGQKVWRVQLTVWIYCNLLKFHKTAKTFFGKAWHWNHRYLEKLGNKLGGDELEPSGPDVDRFDYFASSS
jgi:hypothetical protein